MHWMSALLIASVMPTAFAAPTLLHCGRVIDVRALSVLSERTIIVDGNKITGIERGYKMENGASTVDLKSHTCMPGLIDLHVHITMEVTATLNDEFVKQNAADFALRAVPYAEKTLMAGFTSVRDLLSPHGVAVSVRNAINTGKFKGPRIHAAGIVATTGGHGDLFRSAHRLGRE